MNKINRAIILSIWSFLLLSISTIAFSEEVIGKGETKPDGSIETTFFIKDKEIARQTTDAAANIIAVSGKIPDGIVKQYYPNGSLHWIGNMKDNKPDGTHKEYNEKGSVIREVNFSDGKKNSLKVYNENGQLTMESNFIDGKIDTAKHYYYNEKNDLIKVSSYKDGKEQNVVDHTNDNQPIEKKGSQ